MHSARNHHVQYQPQLVFESEGDPFANAAKRDHFAGFAFADGWDGCAKQEWAGDSCAGQSLTNHPTIYCVEIDGDVRQLRHELRIRYFMANGKGARNTTHY